MGVMDFIWIGIFIVFLIALLVAVRALGRYVVRKQPPEPEEQERTIDSVEKFILQYKKATYLYISAALVSVTVILFFSIRALAPLLASALVPAYDRGTSSTEVLVSSIKMLTILAVWGGIFLPFFTKLRLLQPENRSHVQRFIVTATAVCALVLVAALLLFTDVVR